MQKILLPQKSGLLSVLAGMLLFAGLTGCGGSGSSSGNGGGGNNTPVVTPTVITIDNAGVIPVFGNSSTSTVVYVHNNGTTAVSGISYFVAVSNSSVKTSLSSKLLSLFSSNKSLSSTVNGSQCSTIAAGQACPLSITTPVLSGSNLQGSLEIRASYTQNNKATTFTQLISYAQVQNNLQTAGAKFQAGVSISGYGNSTGYATLYVYGSGQNQVYDVSSMATDKPAVMIVNGNISGHQIQSNFVQAVEVSSPILSSSISATITVNSSTISPSLLQSGKSSQSSNKSLAAASLLDAAGQFSNSVSVTVDPSAAGAILTTGLVPLINTANGTSGSMLVRNSGNQTATVGAVTAGTGVSNLSGCSSASLGVGDFCTINFNVTESGGSASITVPYTGGSASNVVGNVTWFNGSGAALVSMTSSANPLSFPATVGGSTTITVENIGGYTLTNISIPAPIVVGGSATATLGTNNCAGIESLPIGDSCTYDVNVNDNSTETSQQINVGFSASYAGVGGTKAYSRVFPITYSSTANGAVIAITPGTANMVISGNSVESTTTELTVSNSGNLPSDITILASGNQPSYLVESSNTCTSTLAANSSCLITLKLGPTYSSVESSGTEIYTVNYTASGQTPSGSVTSNVDWQVQAYDLSLSLTSQAASGSSSGTGLSGVPYVFNGNASTNKLITLTYTNSGNSAVKLTGIQDTNLVYAWQIGGNGTTCTAGTTVLQPSGTCSIVYTNVLESNILALGSSVGAVYAESVIVPTLIYQGESNSGLQFQVQPNLATGGTTIYAQSNQATLANTITVNRPGTRSESVTVSHLLANATGYSSVFVTTQMEDYFVAGPGVNSPTCASTSANGVREQTCTLSSGQLTGSVTYMVNQTLLNSSTDLNLTALFSNDASDNGLIVSMNPLFAIANLGKSPPPLIFVTTGTYYGGSLLQVANASIPAPNPALTSGLAAGDYLCNLQAATNPTTYPGSYKALLAGTDRVPGGSDWVLQANKTYSNQLSHIIGTTDANAQLPAALNNSIGSDDDEVWSGFNNAWGVSAGNNCGTWASGGAGNGTYGVVSSFNYANDSNRGDNNPGYLYYDEFGDPGLVACYLNLKHFYCVQQ